MDLVEMRADVSTLRESRPEKCGIFSAHTLLRFSLAQLLSGTILPPVRPAGCRGLQRCHDLALNAQN